MKYEKATFYNILRELNFLKEFNENELIYLLLLYGYEQGEV